MPDQNAAILVVDDVAANRDLLIRRLQRLGFADIEEAENGVEALAALGRKPFDLVLLDIMMPEMDGFGVLEVLRGDGRINDMPVIVISALNEIEPVVRCIELGADDFLFKPFNPTLLRARVLATLEKKALRDLTREELRRKHAELSEARTLQLALVPPAFAGTLAGHPVLIDALLEPAKEVGGDLVDHFPVGDGLMVLAIGDVSDKGAGAALMMARTYALFRALAARPDAVELFADPARAASAANDALSRGNPSCMFVTFLLATVDVAAGRLSYVRAGHVPPYLRRVDGTVQRLSGAGGPPLGVVDAFSYQSSSVDLAPGDRLLAVTDGVTEAPNAAGEVFGEDRVGDFLTDTDGEGTLARLAAAVRAFEAGLPAFDDLAAILLRFGAAEGGKPT